MKSLRIFLVLSALIFGSTANGYPKQSPERIREIASMLRPEAGFSEMHVSNRIAWDRIATDETASDVIRSAEAIISKPMERLDDSVYTNQDKEVWGPISGRRGRSIMPLAFAECMENRGRFLPGLVERLDAIAAQTTWMNPYHDRPEFGNFYGKYSTIDLNVSEIACNVAIVLDVLKGEIPENTVSNLVRKTWQQCYRTYLRSADDYAAYHPKNGWFFGGSNWNPACHYQSVVSALFMIPDRGTRAKFIEAAERAMPYYLAGFSAEGYCEEGPSYFDYGYGQYARLGLFVRKATAGGVDFFADPKAKRCCLYGYEFQLCGQSQPQFGDGRSFRLSADVLALCELVWPELISDVTSPVTMTNGGLANCLARFFADNRCERPLHLPSYRLPIRTYYSDAQVYIGRPDSLGAYSLSCCIKGGNNGVSHNHNDAGQFIVALGGTQMVQDPGGKNYDFDTFGPKRYNSPMLNSYGHSVPLPSGLLQGAGGEFKAKVMATSFSDEKDSVTLDLRGAYPADKNLKTLTRRLVYDRVRQCVGIRDHVVFSKASTYESPISTYGTVEKSSGKGCYTIVRKSDHGEKRLSFSVDTGGLKWHVKEERILNPGWHNPTRFSVVIDEPVAEATVSFVFQPESMPPDLDWSVGVESGDPFRGPWVTNWFSVAEQKLDVMRRDDGKWRFSCKALRCGRKAVSVGIELDAETKGGKTSVNGRIINCEPGARVFAFDGPYPAKRYRITDGKSEFLFPWSNGVRVRKFPPVDAKGDRFGLLFSRGESGRWSIWPKLVPEYPSRRCMMQWFAVTEGDDRTFYYQVKDPVFGAKQAKVEFDAQRRTLRFGFLHRLYLHSDRIAVIPTVEFGLCEDGWHSVAHDYGAWLEKARPYVCVPDKVKDCSTLMLLLCKQQNGEIVWPYGDFDKLGDAALKYGIRHIKILARGPGGHDNRYPDYRPDPMQGGTNALMKGLAELKKRGIETYAYVNGQLIECGTTEYWKTGGGSTAGVLNRDGTRAHEAWRKYTDRPAHEFDVACPYDRTWLEKMMTVTQEARYLGFDGMYFDQVAKQWPWQCWATNHGHCPGDWVWVEDRARYLRGIHDEMVKSDPDFILTSEGFNETVSDSCAIHLGLGDSSTIRERFDEEAIDYKFPEMAFYTIPRLRTSDRYPSPHRCRDDVSETAIAGYATDIEVRYPCDRRVFEKCENVTTGDYGTVYGPPICFDNLDTADLKADRDYFKAVNDFRYANREILLRGKYEDTDGFAVETTAKKWMAKRWTAADGKTFGVLVWNAEDRPAKFAVLADGGLLGVSEPEAGTVDALSPIPGRSLRLYRYALGRHP